MHILDASEFQPSIDWGAVFAVNGAAAIIRNLYGTSHVDIAWAGGRRASARAAGAEALGIYQYIVAGQDITAQAQEYVRQVGSLRQGEFAIMDLEEGSGDQSGRAHTWLNYVNAHLPAYKGYHGAWLYSYVDFVNTHNLGGIFAGTTPTWIAAYQLSEPSTGHSLWQHSNGTDARCRFEPWPGGAGFLDCSSFNGSLFDLKSRIYDQGGATPPPNPSHFSAQEEVVNITRDDFTRLGGSVPIALPTAATAVRFFSNSPAHIRVDTRSDSGVVDVQLTYDSAHNIICPVNAIVVHRDDPADVGTNDVSYAINY